MTRLATRAILKLCDPDKQYNISEEGYIVTHFPTKQELKALKEFKKPYCLSIYVPFEDPAALEANRIELKNLLQEAKTTLLDAGADERIVRKTMAPIQQVMEDHDFWLEHRESLSVFAHPELFRMYTISGHSLPHQLTVGHGFNLDPLEQAMQDDQPYFVLTLSHNHVGFFKGGHYSLEPVELKDFPANMKQALRIDEQPNWLESHAVASASQRGRSEAFHGQYEKNDTDKKMLLEFFRRIDKRLRPYLRGSQAPLIIGGVEYLQPLYRRANTYPYLADEGILGNLEHATLNDLRDRAWPIVQSFLHS